ncbi:MAG TPA: 2-oxo acid dehydrogenase subunit E2, partial [Pelovirga sp.]|nr:2-oxo acid dehydrogenase subunit E2 [Pelovirga sp.]
TMEQLSGGAAVSSGEFRGLHAQRPLPDFSKWGDVERKPLSKIRQVTADVMGYAWSTIPMVTQYDAAAVDGLENFRQDYNRKSPEVKLTMTAILLKVCAAALKEFPQFNTSLDLAGQELIYKKFVHVGVAVDTDKGLLVPVVCDADRKGINQLAADLNGLAEKARARKLSPDEMDGGTFTISNLGGIGGSAFTPIVYAPQVAILGVSRTENRPIWNGQEFVPQQMMPLCLSYDHRVIDGADGARFLRWICEALEQPLKLLM